MRVGIIAYQLDRNPNTGPSVYLENIILKLSNFDDVQLYIIHATDNPPIKSANVINIKLPKSYQYLYKIKNLELDILHLNYLPKLRELMFLRKINNKPKIAVTVHGDEVWTVPEYVPAKKWLIYWRRTLDIITSKFVDNIIAVSNSLKHRLVKNLKVPPDKISVVYNGVDHKIFRPKCCKKFIKERGIDPYSYVLHVSNYQPIKNAETLFEAFDMLAEKYDVYLVIAGGRWEEKINELKDRRVKNKDNIIYVGKVSKQDLASLYSHSICFVSPSLHETFGLTFVEAMACGCPVIGSNVTSMPEIIRDAGILLDNPRDKYELAKAMELLINDRKLRKKLSRKGIYRAKLFDWEKTARGVYDVYKRTIHS